MVSFFPGHGVHDRWLWHWLNVDVWVKSLQRSLHSLTVAATAHVRQHLCFTVRRQLAVLSCRLNTYGGQSFSIATWTVCHSLLGHLHDPSYQLPSAAVRPKRIDGYTSAADCRFCFRDVRTADSSARQIRRILWIRGLTAYLLCTESCGRGLTLISTDFIYSVLPDIEARGVSYVGLSPVVLSIIPVII